MSAMTSLITIAVVIGALGVLSWILFVIVFIVQNRAFKKEMREAEKKMETNRKKFEQRVEKMDFAFEERKRQRRGEAEYRTVEVRPLREGRMKTGGLKDVPKKPRPERPSCIVVREWDGKVISGLREREDLK